MRLIVSANIRHARLATGHTQESLARALGLANRTVQGWELGTSTPTRRNLEALASELGQSPGWFYTDHSEPVAA